MWPLKAIHKGPRISNDDAGTPLDERPQRNHRLRKHEQGTDTEQEAHRIALSGASQRYLCPLKPDTSEHRSVDYTGTQHGAKLHDLDQCATEQSHDSQPRRSTICEKELQKDDSRKAKGNLRSKCKSNGSKFVLSLRGPEREPNKETLPKQVKHDLNQTPMEGHREEDGKANQAEECHLINHDKAVVDVPVGASEVEAVCKDISSRKSDAVLDHVSNDTIDEVCTSSKLRPCHQPEDEDVKTRATSHFPRLSRSRKTLSSPERSLRSGYRTDGRASAASFISMLSEVNKGLEARIRATELKVDKQRDKTAVLADQLRRIQAQADHLEGELAEAQIMSQHYISKTQLKEEDGHILANRIHEAEEALAVKLLAAKGHMEGRLERCQGALGEALAERQAALREIRQLERRIDEKVKLADEERKQGREFQERKDKIDEQIKKLEARLYDAKLECSLEKARRMDVERQVGDALGHQARLKRELAACSELGSPWSVTGTSSRYKHGARPLSVEGLRSALR
ncbi:hypothetical protein HPB52_025595 [Rhipicephalus sanguineus]|uniref:Myosin tail domain-containing protein n=1 Tax=Rhipicephalus sanguineus TaxID=34632 RepID=A0A9D4YR87_RHISA|nr:hypothetical protein HPB52_025595 [Rhipicephalus sanguineus]